MRQFKRTVKKSNLFQWLRTVGQFGWMPENIGARLFFDNIRAGIFGLKVSLANKICKKA
jgi:hypothetical protein